MPIPGSCLIADEERDLLGGDADGAGLAAQLAPDLEECRAERFREREGVYLGRRLRHIVNPVNDSRSVTTW